MMTLSPGGGGEDMRTIDLEDLVVLLEGLGVVHRVGEPAAASPADADLEPNLLFMHCGEAYDVRVLVLAEELLDPADCGFRLG